MRTLIAVAVLAVVACSSDVPEATSTTTDPCVMVDELAAPFWDTFGTDFSVEQLAVLAEQNPDCFDPAERMLIESSYRAMLRRLAG